MYDITYIISAKQLKMAMHLLYDMGYHWNLNNNNLMINHMLSYYSNTYQIHIKNNILSWDHDYDYSNDNNIVYFNKILREYKLKRILK